MQIKGKKIEMSCKFDNTGNVKPITLIKVVDLPEGARLDAETPLKITGFSKGRGYSGVVKRHGFKGGPATHGQSDRHRAPGAIGNRTTPGRVYKGKRMAGHFGNHKVTVLGSKVIEFDTRSNVLKVLGPIPGARGSEVMIRV